VTRPLFQSRRGIRVGTRLGIADADLYRSHHAALPHNAEIYFQCIEVDAATFQIKSNVTFGPPGVPGSSLGRKVHGYWLFSHVQGTSFAPPTLDVPQ